MPVVHIKNMVCARCMKSVAGIFQSAGIGIRAVRLGAIDVTDQMTTEQLNKVRELLSAEGFEILDDQRAKLIEQIKNEIVKLVHYSDLGEMKVNLSTFLSNNLLKDYNYLSNLFSSVEGTTIEQFFLLQKIEKVKELLVYNEFSLSEIAFQLDYSSVAHLSAQFKKITGLTPSQFKKLNEPNRKHLDSL